MSWLFSRALVEASLGVNFSDGIPSAQSSGMLTPQAYCAPGKTTDFSRPSRFGMTFGHLTDDHGAAVLTWCLADSLARTSVLPEKATALAENDPASGPKWRGSLARYDHDSRSWKTAQHSLLGDSDEYLETWPRWGTTRAGELYLLPTLVPTMSVNESGSFVPTPTATDFKSESMSRALVEKRMARSAGVRLTEFLHRKTIPTPNAGNDHWGGRLDEWGGSTNPFRGTEIGKLPLNPCWVEELMGWPVGWTDLQPLETDKYLKPQPLRGVA